LATGGADAIDIEAARRLLPGGDGAVRLLFVDGHFNRALSSENPPGGAKAGSIAASIGCVEGSVAAHLARSVDYSNHAFTALNTAFLSDGAFIEIASGAVIDVPIYVVYVSTGTGAAASVSHPRSLIVAGHHSQAAIVELYIDRSAECGMPSGGGEEKDADLGDREGGRKSGGRYFTNAVTEIVVGDGAVVSHTNLQQESAAALHIGGLYASLGRDSSFNSNSIALGGTLVRNDISVVLGGEGVDCELNGLYIEKDAQHVDNHTLIDHARPHGSSRENYKGILDGRSTGVFNGSIVVRKDAQKTDARQSNKNLLLSADAEINTKPQLEILADDVKCSHGATIGHIDQEAIFYMRSRGIDEPAARSLMMYAFCNEILERIKPAEVRELMTRQVFNRITGGRWMSEVI